MPTVTFRWLPDWPCRKPLDWRYGYRAQWVRCWRHIPVVDYVVPQLFWYLGRYPGLRYRWSDWYRCCCCCCWFVDCWLRLRVVTTVICWHSPYIPTYEHTGDGHSAHHITIYPFDLLPTVCRALLTLLLIVTVLLFPELRLLFHWLVVWRWPIDYRWRLLIVILTILNALLIVDRYV